MGKILSNIGDQDGLVGLVVIVGLILAILYLFNCVKRYYEILEEEKNGTAYPVSIWDRGYSTLSKIFTNKSVDPNEAKRKEKQNCLTGIIIGAAVCASGLNAMLSDDENEQGKSNDSK